MADNWLTEGWGDALFGDESSDFTDTSDFDFDDWISFDFDTEYGSGLGSLYDEALNIFDNPDWADTYDFDFDFEQPPTPNIFDNPNWAETYNFGDWDTSSEEYDFLDPETLKALTPDDAWWEILGAGSSKTPKAIKAIEDIIKSLGRGAEAGAGRIAGGIGGLMDSTLGQLALLNYMRNKDKAARNIPMGQQAYGSSEVYGNVGAPDYRVFNIQPALMPGVAYANVAQPGTPPPPPPMRQGGIAGLASQKGPGDITLAKLEPGEFVVTKKATDNIGAQNLYRMMKQWEGMS